MEVAVGDWLGEMPVEAGFDGPPLVVVLAVAGDCDEIRRRGSGIFTDGAGNGVAVHAGARIAASAGPAEVLVSQSVRDLVSGSDLQFDSARTVTLKGLPGEWRLYPLATT